MAQPTHLSQTTFLFSDAALLLKRGTRAGRVSAILAVTATLAVKKNTDGLVHRGGIHYGVGAAMANAAAMPQADLDNLSTRTSFLVGGYAEELETGELSDRLVVARKDAADLPCKQYTRAHVRNCAHVHTHAPAHTVMPWIQAGCGGAASV